MESKISATERNEFALRLNEALAEIGFPASGTILAREFNARADGASVTPLGARKWLLGEAFPTQARLSILAQWLNVSPQWLRFGGEPMRRSTSANDETLIPREELLLLTDFRRLDARSQAIALDMIASLLKRQKMRM